VRSKSLFELASVPPVHSESLFEPAVQDHYSKVLVSVALCSEPLHSALLCCVHGYARVHTSIYIYVYAPKWVHVWVAIGALATHRPTLERALQNEVDLWMYFCMQRCLRS